jgi:hypothetical protein
MSLSSSYVISPVYGPLNTNRYPGIISTNINRGILYGIKPSPVQFYPSQEPVNSSQFVNARQYYLRTIKSNEQLNAQREKTLQENNSLYYYTHSSQRKHLTTGHVNYIAPVDSSQHLLKLKANAIGKSSYKQGLPLNAPISTKNYDTNVVKSAMRRTRNIGYAAPAKKGK